MDSLRGPFYDAEFGSLDPEDSEDGEAFDEAPPSPVGQDERRMQVRAYNFWASLLANRDYPAIEDLDPQNLPDFGPNSVLLDFTGGVDNPAIPFLGELLVDECGGDGSAIGHLGDVPGGTLLSRITDHYLQIIANQAPIGFEAEFVSKTGNTVLYRGILLPFSSDDETIDFIYGVINWKELADQDTTDALMLEVDRSLEQTLAEVGDDAETDAVAEEKFPPAPVFDQAQVDGWADGPGSDDDDRDGDAAARDPESVDPVSGHLRDDAPLPGGASDRSGLPEPSFGLTRTVEMISPPDEEAGEHPGEDIEVPLDLDDFVDDSDANFDPAAYAPDYGDTEENETGTDSIYASLAGPGLAPRSGVADEAYGDDYGYEYAKGYSEAREQELLSLADDDSGAGTARAFLPAVQDAAPYELTEVAPEDMGLADWLASARELAHAARHSEERTRHSLYHAIGRAYDFSLAALQHPEDFAELAEEAGLAVQDRAPMTPVVKLVFGADYDKTRVTEYAAALSHAHRLGVERGELAPYLAEAKGGLKGIVRAERKLRRAEQGKPDEEAGGPRASLTNKLRSLPPHGLEAVESEGAEFALLMMRRAPDGTITLLGEVPEDVPLVERAARMLLDRSL